MVEIKKVKDYLEKLRNQTFTRSRSEVGCKWKMLIKAITETVLEEDMRLTVLDCSYVSVTHRSTQIGNIIYDTIGCSAHVVLRESKVGGKTQISRCQGETRIYPSCVRTFAVKTTDICQEF